MPRHGPSKAGDGHKRKFGSDGLGPRNVVHDAVSKIFPSTDWTDPAWGVWDSEFGSVEFNVGTDPAEGMMLHVRAEAAVVPAIAQLCAANGWQGIDCSAGAFIEKAGNPEEGLLAWRACRNRVVGLEDSQW